MLPKAVIPVARKPMLRLFSEAGDKFTQYFTKADYQQINDLLKKLPKDCVEIGLKKDKKEDFIFIKDSSKGFSLSMNLDAFKKAFNRIKGNPIVMLLEELKKNLYPNS